VATCKPIASGNITIKTQSQEIVSRGRSAERGVRLSPIAAVEPSGSAPLE
jgi:hypothetical protein